MLAVAFFLGATLAVSFSTVAATISAVNLSATKSGSDLILSFPTSSPGLYTVQTSPDLQSSWASFEPGVKGDGTVKLFTVTNALSGGAGFYRLLIQTPTKLLLPQSLAFAVLGHSCGGIKEQTYVTGFDPSSRYPVGEVYLSTTCSTGGRGSRPATFTAWAAVTWDLAGNVLSSTTLSNAASADPTFIASDGYGDAIYNAGTAAYLGGSYSGCADRCDRCSIER